MGQAIKLKETYDIKQCLCLVATNKCIDSMERVGNLNEILNGISSSRVMLIHFQNNKSGGKNLVINTRYGNCICAVDQENYSLLIIQFNKSNFESQNNAIRDGVCFNLLGGVCVSVKNIQRDIFLEYRNGKSFDTNYTSNEKKRATIAIIGVLNELEARKNTKCFVKPSVEKYQPTDALKEILNIAKKYSEIINEREEILVHESGRLVYTDIQALDYNRTDRVAYRFVVEKLKKDVFSVGSQVEICDLQEKKHNAEIINSEIDENGEKHIDLLFNNQINILSFEKIGFISLSFSTVIRDVQLEAINKIYNGTSNSQYMDNVLGCFSPQGFENNDLSCLIKHYNDKNFYKCPPFPPNPSQQMAIIKGIQSKDVFLVMGPPGTGKTTVILEWIKYFVLQKNMRVLVSSQNNKAVDNVLERIIEENDIDVLRIGSETKLQENVKSCMFENKISALRENIVNCEQENTEKINRFIEKNSFRYNEVLRLEKVNNDLNCAIVKLDNQIKEKLIGLYKDCNKLYKKTNRKKSAIESNINCTKKLIGRYDKALTKNSSIFKLMILIYSFFIKKIIVFKSGKLKKQKLKFDAIKIKCDELFNKYKVLYNKIKEEEFATFLNIGKVQNDCIEKVHELICERDDFGINTLRIEKHQLKEDLAIDCIKEQLCLFQKKAFDTIKIISEWSNEMKTNQNYALNDIVLNSVNLVGATCIGINSQKRFANLNFDVTIIDEAGQIQIHNALVPMSVSNKLIMLGDHKQIPPPTDPEIIDILNERNIDIQLYEKSLFGFMYDKFPPSNKQMLDTQFRMPGEIADIISEWFYDGEYHSADFKRNVKSLLPTISNKPLILVDTGDNANRFETEIQKGVMKERYNDYECDIIVEICLLLRKQGFDFSEIGIISALKAQVNRIKEKMVMTGFEKKSVNEIVATLDSFQGQERKIIIYSFTRSSKKSTNATRVGFLTELRRLNVAMSRCKQNIILIGDFKYLSECERTVGNKGEIIIAEKTEKNFSEFIKKMLEDVNLKGRGDILSSSELMKKIVENA